MGPGPNRKIDRILTGLPENWLGAADTLLNWARARSLWPMFFGLSCCFVEEATSLTSRYDLARFGAEVMRPSPRQADLLIVSGTVFKKVAPVVLRLYEQMAEPKWVISMGSCCNSGGMYDVYSVVQGVNQILPVDVYIPGCPPRPEAVLKGITLLQQKIEATEHPIRRVFHLGGGSQGSEGPVLVDGATKSRDPRGPGMEAIPIRGSAATPPHFPESRFDLMWGPPAHRITLAQPERNLMQALEERFGRTAVQQEPGSDMPAVTVSPAHAPDVLTYLKKEANPRFLRLEDVTAIDERARQSRQPSDVDFTLVYHLLAFDPPTRMRIRVPLPKNRKEAASIATLWPSANWYEREVFDLFGIRFAGHPRMERLLLPPDWEGHPLCKDYPGRATDMLPYTLADAKRHQPLDAGLLVKSSDGSHRFVLNIGPHHVSTHGLMRFVAALDGECIEAIEMDIGYHHRGVEKIAERQHWHQFIPYTDRVDYLSGAANNLPYVQAVETVAGIAVPDRAQFIRVLVSELYRISNHLVFFGTLSHDTGAMTPTFYTFREREMVLDIIEAITGGRLHASYFRIGGVALDLPEGWKEAIDRFVRIFPQRLREYESLITQNPVFRARTSSIGRIGLAEAIDWGVTGPNLRACGLDWDLRKRFPYAAYSAFDFDVPTETGGDCYARYKVRVSEMRESLRIIEQAARAMPEGPYICPDYRYAVPPRERMLNDIETLIHHFVNVSRGPSIPKGEAYSACEVPRGEQGYFVVSDGLGYPYRLRIRSPGFANVQPMPILAKGATLSDLIAIIGSVDYILPDIDR